MEQNLPIVTKKIWKIIRVVYLMVRKGISKGKLLADLATLMKRGKIAGKAAIHNLMFHHHHHSPTAGRRTAAEYEFSCGNSPLIFGRRAVASPLDARALAAALEIVGLSAGASPALPGFGPSPMVRQLRITDSPFPVRDSEEDSRVVDEAAEEFIARFYKDLKRQNAMAYLGYS
ncbi:retinal dehydrogenase 1 [Striga asiatica]|uniref:Retinal dehydrogenase 1 n=1 Tax=Striga asiatica TaxID=4170 RepID=A0A5A7QIU6_STRAF|nr:retinal dehydrogenase 1 [Striga asiatica]